MTTKGNRKGGRPILIQGSSTTFLDRIPLTEQVLSEKWIQKLIHENPNILPVNEIEMSFSPLIPIGREVSTKSGKIDNLFISPEGYLTIVETKLWRNPEARREVVGQIIDYAKELSKWTFSDLDKNVKNFNQLYDNNGDGVLATVKRQTELDETDEQLFIDNINRNLKRGRFLLLIVGDGIRESVEDMVEYLSQNPQLYFTLALIELQTFSFNKIDNSKIIIPQIVTRTREITRAIVRIEGTQIENLKIDIETDLGTEINKRQSQSSGRLTITAQDYFDQLEKNTDSSTVDFANSIIIDCQDLGLVIEWNTSSFGIKLPDPQGSGIRIAIFTVDKFGCVSMGLSKPQFEKLELPLEISHKFSADTAAMLPGITPNAIKKHRWAKSSTLADLNPVYLKFMNRVEKYIEDITSEGQKVVANKNN